MVCTQRCPSAARIRRLLVGSSSTAITPVRSLFVCRWPSRALVDGSISPFSGSGTRGTSDLLDSGFVPGHPSCPRRCTYRAGPYRAPTASVRSSPTYPTAVRRAGASVPEKRVFSLFECEMKSSSPFISTTDSASRALLWTSLLGVGELVVPWRVRISLVILPEFLQTTYRKVVEWFFRPVFALRIVEPFDEV